MSLRGLYAITSEALCREPTRLRPAVQSALRGGAALIQYRDKWNAPPEQLRLARELATLCRDHGTPLIVNDDPQLAAAAGAGGVHLGASDGACRVARQLLGPRALIGMTCGNRLERALAAQDDGADYVSFGRFFDSLTKPEAPPASVELLQRARGIRIPICAIGGLTPENATPLVAAGASLIAAVGGVFGADDVETAARRYAALFAPRPPAV